MQVGFAVAKRFKRAHGLDDVVAVGAGAAVALPHVMQRARERQTSGILDVAAVDDETERANLAPRLLLEFDAPDGLQINAGDLFARAQIRDRRGARRGSDAKSHPAAHAATIEPQHQSGTLRRAAMHERVNAQRPMQTDQPRRHPLDEIETRTPHQRAVAEHPQVFVRIRIDKMCHRANSRSALGPDSVMMPGGCPGFQPEQPRISDKFMRLR